MKLTRYLIETGTTQSALARRTGFSQPTISELCRKRVNRLSRRMALAIYEATGGKVTPNDILGIGAGPNDGEDVDGSEQFEAAE